MVSALLGERAKPFLAIPFGPLQVGHFVGSLVIVLMAFIEYPGFPLTNLPTPLRGCFQGGTRSTMDRESHHGGCSSECVLFFWRHCCFLISRHVLLFRSRDSVRHQCDPRSGCGVQGTGTRPTDSSVGDQDVHGGRARLRPIHATADARRNRKSKFSQGISSSQE